MDESYYGVMCDYLGRFNDAVACVTLDPRTKQFIMETTNQIQELTDNTTKSKVLWLIPLMQKYKWMTLMLALKIAPNIVATVAKLITANDVASILKFEDQYGVTCCINSTVSLEATIELIAQYGSDTITTPNTFNVAALDMLVYTGSIEQILENNIIALDTVLNYRTNTKMTALHIAVLTRNITSLNYFMKIGRKLPREFLYAQDSNGNTALMVACICAMHAHAEILAKSALYASDILTINNHEGLNIMKYMQDDMLKMLMDLVDTRTFIEHKLWGKIMSMSVFQTFTKSKLYTYDL